MTISSVSSSSVYDVSQLNKTSKYSKINSVSDDTDDNRPEPPSLDKIISQLTSKLNLSDDQAKELKKIMTENMKSMDEDLGINSTQNSGRPPKPTQEMMEKMKTKMDAMDDKIRSIFNPDQLTTFNNMLAERNKPKTSVNTFA